MTKTREIIRLKEQAGLSNRQIANLTGVSRPVIAKIINIMTESNFTFATVKNLSDSQLQDILKKHEKPLIKTKHEQLKERFPEISKELKKTGVTLYLLWEEYLKEVPDGLMYSQFCYHFHEWKKDKDVALHIDHKAGDKMMVDYTGDKMYLTSRETGKKSPVEVFVAILPASQLTYAEASPSQNQESFMRSNERAIRYFGGVPSAIVPDNLKSGVLKPDLYEPELNPLFADFAEYYRTTVVPARVRKPKDKGHVENAVKILYTRIFATLRNKTFYTLEELNEAIWEKLEIHNNKPLNKMEVSRRQLFEQVEKKALGSFPFEMYPLKYFQNNTRVQYNYHICLKEDKHYYSVPYLLKDKQVKIIYDDRNVTVYHENIRIVQHQRDRHEGQYTTVKKHMPHHHRFDKDWNPDRIKWLAGNVGEDTQRAVEHILNTKPYPEQAYKSCMGVLSLAEKHGHSFLNLACRKAWNMERINYQYIKEQVLILHDLHENEMDKKQLSLIPKNHENIRGEQYYQ